MVSRRKFSQMLGSSLLLSALPVQAQELEQDVHINLPSYKLKLSQGNETLVLPVGIGKGARGKAATPVLDGYLSEKRRRMNIRYGKDYPEQGIVKGDIITWDHTFDKNGKPFERKMPYERMRSIQMKLIGDNSDRFVIHSTTDEFTLGTPTSSGCIRVGLDDMLRLYNATAPDIRDGVIPRIPLSITYNVVEIEDDFAVMHANVYHHDLDYIEEFRRAALQAGLNPDGFDHGKIRSAYDSSRDNFERAYTKILDTLDKGWPNNFIQDDLKAKLHKKHHLYDFL